MKSFLLVIFLIAVYLKSAAQSDTVKCYVQVMYPFSNTVGMHKEIEDTYLFKHGGMLVYTKAYAIRDANGRYIKFLSVRKRELTDIWKPNDQPQVMIHNW